MTMNFTLHFLILKSQHSLPAVFSQLYQLHINIYYKMQIIN